MGKEEIMSGWLIAAIIATIFAGACLVARIATGDIEFGLLLCVSAVLAYISVSLESAKIQTAHQY